MQITSPLLASSVQGCAWNTFFHFKMLYFEKYRRLSWCPVTVWLQTSFGVCARQCLIHGVLPFPLAADWWPTAYTLSLQPLTGQCICAPGQAGPCRALPVPVTRTAATSGAGEGAWGLLDHKVSRACQPRNTLAPNPHLPTRPAEGEGKRASVLPPF